MFIHEKVRVGKNVTIGHGACIGYGDPDDGEIIIGDDVSIGAFSLIHFGTVLKNNVEINQYCSIGPEVTIGKGTKILPGKEVTYKAEIGSNCIIGGNVPDRTIIEDNVTYMGEIAHAQRDPNLDWDTNEETSPIILKGSFIGVQSLLIGVHTIGPCAYVGAGEIVRCNVGEGMAFLKNRQKPISELRGLIKSRCHE